MRLSLLVLIQLACMMTRGSRLATTTYPAEFPRLEGLQGPVSTAA